MYAKLSDPGQSNGIVRAYVDDVLIGESINNDESSGTLKAISFITNSLDANTNGTFYIDDISVFASSGPDSIPPVRSGGSPSGSLAAGTTQTYISLNTDESATCRYSTNSGTSYSSMVNTFQTTGGTGHSQLITGLSNGGNYNYYVRCNDTSGNFNINDFTISFSVSSIGQTCGNSLVEGIEQCDLTNLSGQTCITQGFDSGTLGCSSSCNFNTSLCINNAQIGNVYYIGNFTGTNPIDNSSCGTFSNPCATLNYWTQNRRSILVSDDIIRIASGTYTTPNGSSSNCIVAIPNVTYEGRTATNTDLNDYTSVVIDANGGVSNGPCYGRGIIALDSNYNNFIARDLKIINATNMGIFLRSNAAISANAVIDRVWADESGLQGAQIESIFQQDIDCSSTGRRLVNFTMIDSKFTNSHGVGAGVGIGCSDGVLIERTEVTNSTDNHCSTTITNQCKTSLDCPAGESCVQTTIEFCRANNGNNACDDHDGIQFQGVANGIIRNSTVTRNGEDNIDIGGHWLKTYDVLVEGNYGHTGGSRNVKVSGGAKRVIIRNNIFVDGQVGVDSCSENTIFEGNTVISKNKYAFMGWSTCENCTVRNNIFQSNDSYTTIFLSSAWTDSSIDWYNNIVINNGGGMAFRETIGKGTCSQAPCSYFPNCPTPWPAVQSNNDLSNNELATFQSEGNSGNWFGPGSGVGDIWGVLPAFVDVNNPNVANLHLKSNDTIAKDSGASLLQYFSTDFDGDTRPQGLGWDIGADEYYEGIEGPVCGNSIIESGEQCDGVSLNFQTCASFGFDSGVLFCSTSCTFDTSSCIYLISESVSSGGGGGSISKVKGAIEDVIDKIVEIVDDIISGESPEEKIDIDLETPQDQELSGGIRKQHSLAAVEIVSIILVLLVFGLIYTAYILWKRRFTLKFSKTKQK